MFRTPPGDQSPSYGIFYCRRTAQGRVQDMRPCPPAWADASWDTLRYRSSLSRPAEAGTAGVTGTSVPLTTQAR